MKTPYAADAMDLCREDTMMGLLLTILYTNEMDKGI